MAENTACFCGNCGLDRVSGAVSVSCGNMSEPDRLCIFYILLKGCMAVIETPGITNSELKVLNKNSTLTKKA